MVLGENQMVFPSKRNYFLQCSKSKHFFILKMLQYFKKHCLDLGHTVVYYVLIPGLDVFVLAIIIMNFLAILEYMIIMAKLSKYRNRTHTTDYEKALEFAQKMDRYSAMIFPIALVVFLLIYFVYYEAISPTVDIRDGLSKQTL